MPEDKIDTEAMPEEEIDTERARAGIMLHRMRFVLGFGLAGAGAALLVAWALFGP